MYAFLRLWYKNNESLMECIIVYMVHLIYESNFYMLQLTVTLNWIEETSIIELQKCGYMRIEEYRFPGAKLSDSFLWQRSKTLCMHSLCTIFFVTSSEHERTWNLFIANKVRVCIPRQCWRIGVLLLQFNMSNSTSCIRLLFSLVLHWKRIRIA